MKAIATAAKATAVGIRLLPIKTVLGAAIASPIFGH
jgi:hypothetical protein